jgi:hypothetical protein
VLSDIRQRNPHEHHTMSGLAVEVTKKALKYFGPSLVAEEYWDNSANKGKGGWLPRLQDAPGPHKTDSKDPHIGGRALDIILFAKRPTEKSFADRIVEVFLDLKKEMHFISVVYNGWEWNQSGVKFPHVDEAHKTHIHIEWSSAGVAAADFGPALEDRLYLKFSAGNLASGDYATG